MSAEKDAPPPPSQPVRAVALRHEPGAHAAPEVVAKGRGKTAERILALARENGVAVREDADLVALLSACDVGDEIPLELYQAVAELLAYLYRLNGELAERA
jgi:flagellar biosynthesis protein